jgi:phosphatidylinositol-4,5-bisphosphate 3-kinase
MFGLGNYRKELLKGDWLTHHWVRLNNSFGKLKHSEALKEVHLPTEFHLPMDPRMIINEELKEMNREKKLFTVGDELQQGHLRLQRTKRFLEKLNLRRRTINRPLP